MKRVAIIGGGLAGLSAAYHLEKNGRYSIDLYEASGLVGGALKSRQRAGFYLDEGFQTFLDSYEEMSHFPYLQKMGTQRFMSCVQYWHEGRFYKVVNPLKHPFLFATLVGKQLPHLKPAMKVLRALMTNKHFEGREAKSIDSFLNEVGGGDPFIEQFLKPFLRGVFQDPGLCTHPSLLQNITPYFLRGEAHIPVRGMQEIPMRMRQSLKSVNIFTNNQIEGVDGETLWSSKRGKFSYDLIINACALHQVTRFFDSLPQVKMLPTEVLYFVTDRLPAGKRPTLSVFPQGSGCLNHLSMSRQKGKVLISATALVPGVTVGQVEKCIRSYFPKVESLTFLCKSYVKESLPRQSPSALKNIQHVHNQLQVIEKTTPTLFTVLYQKYSSINEALASGRKVAVRALAR